MLNELYIENFAIIDSLHLSFPNGMTVLSGETGAGKSIIVGAVSILLGDRASSDLIRSSADSAVVEAQFDISANEAARNVLTELDMYDDDDLVIKRMLSRSGRNRILVNGRLATVSMLATITETLVNICGQHEHQVLLQRDSHIDILDEFGELMEERAEYSCHFNTYRSMEEELASMKAAARDRFQREELIRFQIDEIVTIAPVSGEDLQLADEKRILANARKLRELSEDAYGNLYGNEGSALEKLDRIRSMVAEIKALDPGLPLSKEILASIYFSLEDAALNLRNYLGGIIHDPRRLEEIDDRLELLGILKRKYGGSLEAALEKKESLSRELATMEHLEETIEAATTALGEKKEVLRGLARTLSDKRKKAARTLEQVVMTELKDLRMPGTIFAVVFSDDTGPEGDIPPLHGKGFDLVEFHLSANRGESLKPLHRVASGGELSRIVLALKKVLVHNASAETVIFDEVDSGIGGAAAEMVGAKLRDIARRHQVVCITHLPQIASFAETHFLVTKDVAKGRTMAGVRKISEGERVEEIARMLGGVELTDTTRKHAREMMHRASREG
jgi:DNA repair protein RecN (Recombination protein N)